MCLLLSFFSPEVPVQWGLERARGFCPRAFNSALARLAGCRTRGGLLTRAPRPDDSFNSALARLAGCRTRGGLLTRAPRPDDSRQVSGFPVAPLSGFVCE